MNKVRGLLVAGGLSLAIFSIQAQVVPQIRQTAQGLSELKLNINKKQTSVSGISSGAYMAVQMQVAYSGSIIGAGVVAGGPYHCMRDHDRIAVPSKLQEIADCMMASPLHIPYMGDWYGKNPPDGKALARKAMNSNNIDSLDKLADRKIYLFRGSNDSMVGAGAVDATKSFFANVGVKDENIYTEPKKIPAAHAMLTKKKANPCATFGSPYINNCDDYDQAYKILEHIYGTPDISSTAKYLNQPGRWVKFDQMRYAKAAFDKRVDSLKAVLDTFLYYDGYLYVPPVCAAGEICRIHVAFHGCEQSVENIDTKFMDDAGYNEWANAHRLVILYPQAKSGTANLSGCWDWWGYTNENYATKEGLQMKAVKAMIDDL